MLHSFLTRSERSRQLTPRNLGLLCSTQWMQDKMMHASRTTGPRIERLPGSQNRLNPRTQPIHVSFTDTRHVDSPGADDVDGVLGAKFVDLGRVES